MYTSEQLQRINELRQKSLNNTITIDELKEGIILMRESRMGAQIANKASKTKSKAPARSADDMLSELGGL